MYTSPLANALCLAVAALCMGGLLVTLLSVIKF